MGLIGTDDEATEHYSSVDGTTLTLTEGSLGSSLTGPQPGRMRSLFNGGLRSLAPSHGGLTCGGAAHDAGEGPPAWEQSLQLAALAGGRGGRHESFSSGSSPSREASATSASTGAAAASAGAAGGSVVGAGLGEGDPGSAHASGSNALLRSSLDHANSTSSLRGGSHTSAGDSRAAAVAAAGLVRAPAAAALLRHVGSHHQSSYGSARRSHRTSTSRFFTMLLGAPAGGGAQESRSLSGLRVRMGVVSGVLAVGVDVHNSAVFDLTKGEQALEGRGVLLGRGAVRFQHYGVQWAVLCHRRG